MMSCDSLSQNIMRKTTVTTNEPLIRPNSQAVQHAVLKESRFARSDTNLVIEQVGEKWKCARNPVNLCCVLVTIVPLKKGSWKSCLE
ncbi:hypothetical protein TNCV_3090901 [Trichonephila clavipes]|uniref:Uncharacterized protein n=1 Tax=Trichonephila clavipes TaxID=2585209 RepID=A0A8X7BH54_TRICX|nr:hypothetical protein TNCV_3090901 [Trichonephila clavipes]